MATQESGYEVPYADLAAALLSASEVAPRARLIAEQAAAIVPGAGVVVYVINETGGWSPKATAGEVAYQESFIEFEFGTLGVLGKKREPVVFHGADLAREDYSHLGIRRTLVALAGIPLLVDDNIVGAIEVLSLDAPIAERAVSALVDLGHLAALGLAAGAAYEHERNTQLESITRIAQMYDLEKVFNATLEMDQLLPVICSKFREIMDVQAMNVWMVAGEGLLLMSRAGVDPAYELESSQGPGEGIAIQVADSGEGVCIDSADDERLQNRNVHVEEGAVFSLVAAPILHGGAVVGVAEGINPNDGAPFDEDDLFLLGTMCETAANALHNASLLQAERKVEILETLVKVSQEITSTLNLDRVLQAVVNGPQAVIPYDRATLALERSGKLRIRAVTGMVELNLAEPHLQMLDDMLQWVSLAQQEVYIRQHGDVVEADREETRAKFEKYFAETGMRAFYALPLTDETGRLGMLAFESGNPDFLTSVHLEMLKVLAGQATVALRNAEMYREVPFITILEPVLARKRKFLALEKRRRRTLVTLTAAAMVLLVVVPLPLRLDGDATVGPTRSARVQPEVEGVVRRVYVREGDQVKSGTVLADLEDWDQRAAQAATQARYNTAVAQMNRALAANDGVEAGVQRVQAEYWAAEVTRARERWERTRLRAPIGGVVATPRVENLVGRRLALGDSFAEILDASGAIVNVAVDEEDAPLLQPGAKASLKLDAFPLTTFRGEVQVVSPKSEPRDDHRVFYARVAVPNPEGHLRTGMQGRGKISAGWRPAGYVLFRRTAMWLWSKLWSWVGW